MERAEAAVSHAPSTPAFGQADLTNCEREQIHLARSIQPSGALLVVREPELLVVQESANASEFLRLKASALGRPLATLPGDLAACLRPELAHPMQEVPVAIRCRVGRPAAEFDALVHRLSEGGLVIELEPAGPRLDLDGSIETAMRDILDAASLPVLCDDTARIMRAVTGYDRVMVYRFDDAGHGEVLAEERKPELEAFLGNRYPASDIPQIARKLYERNRVRVLVDIDYTPVPLTPRFTPGTGRDLDMSLCSLRSISPLHVQYLKNMGVGATLVVSLVVGGRLWGLISCHHYSPRFVHFEMRALCELLAEAVAMRITALESFAQAQAEIAVRRLEQRLIQAISRKGDWRAALFDDPQALLQPLDATGAALLFEGEVLTAGEVPGTQQLREIAAWLAAQPGPAVRATASLSQHAPRFQPLVPVASGVVAAPVSDTAGEYLIWFRPERVRTVTWGGNPFKPVLVGDNPLELSPRRSFAQWHQLVEGTCAPWTPADLAAARLIGDTVADVVLQFRAVRTLIVQSQLTHVRHEVGLAEQPVIIGDAEGRIILTNKAFEMLRYNPRVPLEHIDDLPDCFAEPDEIRTRLRDMLTRRRTWRGEARLKTSHDDTRPLMVRADPVFSSPDRVLGFVLLFTDLSERTAANDARRRFQEGIVAGIRVRTGRLESAPDLLFQNLLSSMMENAQLAALEITDGVEVAQIPDMLASVQASITRAAEVLEHLVRHAVPEKPQQATRKQAARRPRSRQVGRK